MKKSALIMSIFVTLAGLGTISYADTIVTDRPDFTESPLTVSLGKFQIESGYTFSDSDNEQQHSVGEVLIRIPLRSQLEARVAINSLAFTTTSGFKTAGIQDSSIGIKANLIQEQSGWIPQTGLIVSTTLPTGGNEHKESRMQPGLKFCVGWALSEKWALSSNLNYDRASESNSSYNQFAQSLSLGWAFKNKWGAYLEAYGFQVDAPESLDTQFINGGVTYLVSDDLQLDARLGKGLNGVNPDHFIGIGFSNRIKI